MTLALHNISDMKITRHQITYLAVLALPYKVGLSSTPTHLIGLLHKILVYRFQFDGPLRTNRLTPT